jgi:hypothetical protein
MTIMYMYGTLQNGLLCLYRLRDALSKTETSIHFSDMLLARK